MKPFYGVDNTNDAKNEKENGDEFLIQKPDANLYEEYDKVVNGVLTNVKKSLKRPLLLTIVQFILIIVASCIFSMLSEYFISNENAEFETMDIILILVMILCVVIFAVLHYTTKSLKRKEDVSEEEHLQSMEVQGAYQRLLTDLGVPPDALTVDILSFNYKLQKDKIKIDKCNTSVPMFYNMEFHIYRDNENFYLVIDSGKYAFKLSSIKTIHKIDNKNAMFIWNKAVPHNKGEYKQYKMKEDEMGNIRCKAYYILEFENNGELHGIYFPEYELETIKTITGCVC